MLNVNERLGSFIKLLGPVIIFLKTRILNSFLKRQAGPRTFYFFGWQTKKEGMQPPKRLLYHLLFGVNLGPLQ